MVFRTISLSAPDIAKWIGAIFVIAAAVWTPGIIFATGLWVLYGHVIIDGLGLATQRDVARIEARIETAATSIDGLTRQITVLSRPDDIVVYRDLPKAAAGACSAGQECPITIFAERDVRALDCRIVPGRTELLIVIDGREYVANVPGSRPGTNLGTSPRALEPVFAIPRGISTGPARAVIRSYYTECPWQIGGQPPAVQDSPSFPLEIRP